MILPDKHIRKSIFAALSGMSVNGNVIPTYDTYTTADCPNFYVIMSTQNNTENKANKCASRMDSSILLDVVTRYNGAGNTGSRLMADDIAQEVLNRIDNLVLETSSGLCILTQTITMPNDIDSKTPTQNIFRKLIRVNFQISLL